MKIVIDARLYGLKHAGIGRYIQNLIDQLSLLDDKNHYTIITGSKTKIIKKPQKTKIVVSDVSHYSLAEQTLFLKMLSTIEADLFHFPHFNVPILFNRPYVVTIHDLLWHNKIGFNVTTLHPVKYLAKYFGYRLVIRKAITNSNHIITPAEFVKNDILRHFKIDPQKISVTYESAGTVFKKKPIGTAEILKKYSLEKPFVIYTGSLYPHKNVINVARAIKLLPNYTLAIASARNVFMERFQSMLKTESLDKTVEFLGFVPDEDLVAIYKHAIALVQPSNSEGFGLTGVEAMFSGLPVIASENKVLREIYQEAALFVDSSNPNKIAQAIKKIDDDPSLKNQLLDQAQLVVKNYSWEKLARQTLEIYKKSVS